MHAEKELKSKCKKIMNKTYVITTLGYSPKTKISWGCIPQCTLRINVSGRCSVFHKLKSAKTELYVRVNAIVTNLQQLLELLTQCQKLKQSLCYEEIKMS